MGPAEVTAKCEPLVKQLRAAKPNTPIILVEDRRFTNDWITPQKRQFHTDNHAALRAVYQSLLIRDSRNSITFQVIRLYGDDSEGATDASHASDLGFMRQATLFEPVTDRSTSELKNYGVISSPKGHLCAHRSFR